MSTELQADWIKQITPIIFQQDELSLFGPVEAFPWKDFEKKIAEQLHLSNLTLTPKEFAWRSLEKIHEGLGEKPQFLFLTLSPLEGQLVWIISSKEIWNLFGAICHSEISHADLQQDALQEGFLHFLALETLELLEGYNLIKGLTPQIASSQELSKSPFLCMDIAIQLENKTFWSRLCLSTDFRRSYKHYRETVSSETFISTIAPTIELTLGIEVGQTKFTVQEWSKINPGDWITLENSNYDPESLKGSVYLTTAHGDKILKGKIRSDHIKLLDLPLHFEEISYMDKDDSHNPSTPEEKGFPEFDENENEEDLLSDDELIAALAEEEGGDSLPIKETDEESEEPEASTEDEESTQPEVSVSKEEKTKPITAQDIPLLISVEVGRLRLSVKELLALQPGNQLSLDKEVDNTVNLNVNGKCIAKGELIRIGDILGVRITQL